MDAIQVIVKDSVQGNAIDWLMICLIFFHSVFCNKNQITTDISLLLSTDAGIYRNIELMIDYRCNIENLNNIFLREIYFI